MVDCQAAMWLALLLTKCNKKTGQLDDNQLIETQCQQATGNKWTGTHQQLSNVRMAAGFLKGHPIVPACSVYGMGITMDTEVTFPQHIKQATAKCFTSCRQHSESCGLRVQHVLCHTKNLTLSVHWCRVDYCNSVFYRTAAIHLWPLVCH